MINYIPLQGSRLHRDPTTGKKLLDDNPQYSIGKWTTKEALSLQELPETQPLLLHCGKSNLIALDFDSQLFNEALAINDSLDAEQQCEYVSKSIGKDGGHLLYKYSSCKLTEYIGNANGKKAYQMDTLYGETLVFHTNRANETKQLLTQQTMHITREIPLAIQYLVIAHYSTHEPRVQAAQGFTGSNTQGSKLGYIAKEALEKPQSMLQLLGIITTQEYKLKLDYPSPLPANHPDRLPHTESGHMYMVSLGNVLRLDPSISLQLYTSLMYKINDLFSQPLPAAQVKTIIAADSKKFNYKEDWETHTFIVTNRLGEPLEIFKHTSKGANKFIIYNNVTRHLLNYDTIGGVIDYLKGATNTRLNKDKILQQAQHIDIINRPDEPFGNNIEHNTFNIYKWNQNQEVFYNPVLHKDSYVEPTTTLRSLENTMGKDTLYKLFLPFLKRKLVTRDHSALFFVLYGVPHSFKSGLFNATLAPLAPQRTVHLSPEVLSDKYNDWIINKDFALLDEVHHLLKAERAKVVSSINKLTGNPTISGVRAMHTTLSSDSYPQEMTLVLTTNDTVQLTSETADRRMVVFRSTRKLSDHLEMTNSAIYKALQREQIDFAYYLATEVDALYNDAYTHNDAWKTDNYRDFLESAATTEDKLALALDSQDLEKFTEAILDLDKNIMMQQFLYKDRRGYKLRLHNTQEEYSSQAGLFNSLPQVDLVKLRKRLKLMPHIKDNLVEYDPGSTHRTGSKKTEWTLSDAEVPYRFKNMVEGVEELTGEPLEDLD